MMLPPSGADRAQADALCAELGEQIAKLDIHAAKLQTELARYDAAGRRDQARRVEHQLRAAARERRELMRLLIGLGHSYPCDHGRPVGAE